MLEQVPVAVKSRFVSGGLKSYFEPGGRQLSLETYSSLNTTPLGISHMALLQMGMAMHIITSPLRPRRLHAP